MNLNMQNCHHRSLQAAAAAAIPACQLQPPPPGPSPPPPPPLAAPPPPLVSGLGGVGDTARRMSPAAFACIRPTRTYGCPVGAPRVALIIKYPCNPQTLCGLQFTFRNGAVPTRSKAARFLREEVEGPARPAGVGCRRRRRGLGRAGTVTACTCVEQGCLPTVDGLIRGS